MSTFDLLFPSKDQVEKYQKFFDGMEYDEVRAVYRPTRESIRAAWNEVTEAAKKIGEEREKAEA